MAASRTASKTVTTALTASGRLSFGKIREPLEVPDLLALQTESFDWLLGNERWQERVAEARAADVVITHSGVGTILQLLGDGISPVVVPRRKQHGEHVDDHQLQIWQLLRDSRVGDPHAVEELSREHLLSRVWGYSRADEIESRTVDVHIRRLRAKLGAEERRIATIKGVGYRFETE